MTGQDDITMDWNDRIFIRLPDGSHITLETGEYGVHVLAMSKLGTGITQTLVTTSTDKIPEAVEEVITHELLYKFDSASDVLLVFKREDG